MRIPPNAKFIDPDATTTSDAEKRTRRRVDRGRGLRRRARTALRAGRVYVVEEGDNPTLIAEKFDVTLEALTSANSWASDYSDFPNVGASIVIPGERLLTAHDLSPGASRAGASERSGQLRPAWPGDR